MTARAGSGWTASLVPRRSDQQEHADGHGHQRHQEPAPPEQVADGHPGPVAGRAEGVGVEGHGGRGPPR